MGMDRGTATTDLATAILRGASRSVVRILIALLLQAAWCVPVDGLRPAAANAAEQLVVRSQSDDDSDDEQWSSEEDFSTRRRRRTRPTDRSSSKESSSSQQMGVEGRLGHIGFKTFGRNESITHAEVLPYVMVDTQMLFGDVRVFTTNQGYFGGNFGVGYRVMADDYDRVFGGSLWYDVDESSGKIFHQAGLSLETYGTYLDGRANFYVPVGDTEKTFSRAVDRAWFYGTSILYDLKTKVGEAMPGLDLELGLNLPGDFSRDHAIRFYGGWYHFIGDVAPDITGYKARMQGNITENLYTQVEVTDDNFYGTNVTLGVALQFSGGSPKRRSRGGHEMDKMRRYVERNYNVIVPKVVTGEYGLTAINPDTGKAYVVQHVDTTATGGSGTVRNPYQLIADAQTAGGDIIFVHSGSDIPAPLTLLPNQRVLGEGVDHKLALQGYGNILMPKATHGTTRPSATGVILANNSEFSGFVMNLPAGDGIYANGLTGRAIVRNVTISGATGDGIHLEDNVGSFLFDNVTVTNATGAGFHVERGSADIRFAGKINSGAGQLLWIEDTTGGTIDLARATLNANGGTGILIDNSDSDTTIGATSITTAAATAIDIQGGDGDVEFVGTTSVNSTAGIGVRANNVNGEVSFEKLYSTATSGAALLVTNTSKLEIDAGSLKSVGGAAADITNTEMNVNLTSVFSDGAAYGVRIVGSDGRFAVYGKGTAGSGGLIQNATTAGIFVQNSGTVGFQGLDLTSNNVGASVDNTDVFQLSIARVTNSTSYGVDALNVRQLTINNSDLTGNGGIGDNTIRFRATAAGSYDVKIYSNMIDDSTDGAIAISSSGAGNGSPLGLLINTNSITTNAISANAVGVNWNGAITANFIDNAIHGMAASTDGFDINATSTTQLTQLFFNRNTLEFEGANSTGLRIATAGTSVINIGRSLIQFDGANGTGMNFVNLAAGATVALDTNTIIDNVSGGTGIQFTQVAGVSRFTINNNWIRLLDPGAGVDNGIIFSTVDDAGGNIILSSQYNNRIDGATTTFFIQPGTWDGNIGINNVNITSP